MFNTLFEEGYAPASCQRWKSLNSSSATLALVFRLNKNATKKRLDGRLVFFNSIENKIKD